MATKTEAKETLANLVEMGHYYPDFEVQKERQQSTDRGRRYSDVWSVEIDDGTITVEGKETGVEGKYSFDGETFEFEDIRIEKCVWVKVTWMEHFKAENHIPILALTKGDEVRFVSQVNFDIADFYGRPPVPQWVMCDDLTSLEMALECVRITTETEEGTPTHTIRIDRANLSDPEPIEDDVMKAIEEYAEMCVEFAADDAAGLDSVTYARDEEKLKEAKDKILKALGL